MMLALSCPLPLRPRPRRSRRWVVESRPGADRGHRHLAHRLDRSSPIYTGNFAKYNETYGSLGAVVVLMLWLFITALCVIIGAELNAELERQTEHDTTEGPDRPMGSRDAQAADTLGPTAEQMN